MTLGMSDFAVGAMLCILIFSVIAARVIPGPRDWQYGVIAVVYAVVVVCSITIGAVAVFDACSKKFMFCKNQQAEEMLMGFFPLLTLPVSIVILWICKKADTTKKE